jgi:hypothetical protein
MCRCAVAEPIDLQVRLALRAQLLTVPGLPAARKWENKAFTPETGSPWIEEAVHRETRDELVSSGLNALEGFTQYTLYFPPDTGVEASAVLVRAIKDRFQPNTALASLLRVYRCEAGPALEAEDWWQQPVTIYWWLHYPRAAAA